MKLLLADRHSAPRRALERMLAHEPDVDVVASVASADEAGNAARRLHPDVAIADAELVSRSGRLLEHWGPIDAALPVIVVGLELHPWLERRVLEQGGVAYLQKDRLADDLPAVLQRLREAAPAAVPQPCPGPAGR